MTLALHQMPTFLLRKEQADFFLFFAYCQISIQIDFQIDNRDFRRFFHLFEGMSTRSSEAKRITDGFRFFPVRLQLVKYTLLLAK